MSHVIQSVGDFFEGLGLPLAAVGVFHQLIQQKERVERIRTQALARRCVKESRAVEGLGEHIARIPLSSILYWENREKGCWDGGMNDSFGREFLRDNPDCRVKCRGSKIQVGYRGSPPQPQHFELGFRDSLALEGRR